MTETGSRRYPERPIVGVGVIVWRGEDVLLIRRGQPPRVGEWSLPGGVQQLGETVYEAAVREVAEETGLTVDAVGIVDVVDSITRDDAERIEDHYTLVDILAEWRAGEAEARDDAADVAWTRPDDLDRFDLWRETVRVIGLSAAQRAR